MIEVEQAKACLRPYPQTGLRSGQQGKDLIFIPVERSEGLRCRLAWTNAANLAARGKPYDIVVRAHQGIDRSGQRSASDRKD